MTARPSLVVVVLTRDEAQHIVACLASSAFADHRLVFDSFSEDETVELARRAGAEVQKRAFVNYADQRNAALEAVAGRFDWALFVDADERVTPELASAVRRAIETPDIAGWRIPRHNYIFGYRMRATGWYPDYQTRLLKVGSARYDPTKAVHEVVLLDGPLGTLDAHLTHFNYQDLRQFAIKQRRYTFYEARVLYDTGIRPRPQNYVLQPLRHFWWRFVKLEGYRDGRHGLRLSLLMAWYEFRKYVLLRGLWRGERK